MKVDISERGAVTDISVRQYPGAVNITQYLLGLSEHDVSDLGFALAQRKAMGRCCTETEGEHTCALSPDHDKAAATAAHQCRGCDHAWTYGSRSRSRRMHAVRQDGLRLADVNTRGRRVTGAGT